MSFFFIGTSILLFKKESSIFLSEWLFPCKILTVLIGGLLGDQENYYIFWFLIPSFLIKPWEIEIIFLKNDVSFYQN